MNIEIRKLSADLLDDWLDFFDNTAFSDNDEWAGCYCMCHHWNTALQSEKEWDCSKSNAAHNRKHAEEYIKKGIMQGYLAYYDGKAAGWCNVNDKQIYDSVIVSLPWDDSEKGKKIKSIVCFCVAPGSRGNGIASRLLEKLCSDAAADGYEYIEAYPFNNNNSNNKAHTGPMSMYEKNGFEACGNIADIITVFRKYL